MYSCYDQKIVELVEYYLKKLRLEHWDVDLYICENNEMEGVMAAMDPSTLRQYVCISINIEKHLDNTMILMEEELKGSIKHELIHVMMDSMDKITSKYLEGNVFELYNEFEEMVVDRLSRIID